MRGASLQGAHWRGVFWRGGYGAAVVLVLGWSTIGSCRAQDSGRAEERDAASFFYQGELERGAASLTQRLAKTPTDDNTRFALGVLQFTRAVETLAKSLHRKGLQPQDTAFFRVPFLRMPVPVNPNPEPIDYNELRAFFATLIRDMAEAEKTLARIQTEDVHFTLDIAKVKLDLGTGQPVPFGPILKQYARLEAQTEADALIIRFDRGDVAWLRGYCHLITAMAKMVLAHDFHEVFDTVGHLFFVKAKTTLELVKQSKHIADPLIRNDSLLDLIALIHLCRFPVKEPALMGEAREHLLEVVRLSRESWKSILAEKDDDHEWIPNPNQKSITGIRVTQEMVTGWLAFLDEAQKLLDGKVLAPFWRDIPDVGINLNKVFTQPKTFDMVLWIHGAGVMPFLDKGQVTQPDTWNQLNRVFQGRFLLFGFWFN